jgi:uncharacterized protein (DUF169 family)
MSGAAPLFLLPNMFSALTLADWKSFGSDRNKVALSPLTLLVGPNASGKSNVLDALRFLQGLALDLPVGEVLRGRYEGGREIWPPIRGSVYEAARQGTQHFSLTLEIGSRNGTYQVGVSTVGDPAIDAERLLTAGGGYLFDTHASTLGASGGRDGGNLRVALWSKGGAGGRSPTATFSSARSLLGQIEPGQRINEKVITRTKDLRSQLRDLLFLDLRPERMRDYVPLHQRDLGVNGENISAVLRALPEATLKDVTDWVSELCAPSIGAIGFEETKLQDVMFLLTEGKGEVRTGVSARSVSDGTLRFLGEVVALLTCPKDRVLLMEEPDVGLHPARIHLLAQLLEQSTKQRGIQVIATTHSPTLLAHLSEESLGSVVAFGRAEDTSTTVCSSLKDLPHFDRLKNSKEIEHLVSTGWVEREL